MEALESLKAGPDQPNNLALVVVILMFVGAFVVSFVVDQYPCWIGVPNCD